MANIVLTWELGTGMGHVTTLGSVGELLSQRGHRLTAVVRDSTRAREYFAQRHIPVLPAPLRSTPVADRIDPPFGYAHILHNVGFADADELSQRLEAWDRLFDSVRADLVIVDHSPAALLALHGSNIRRVTVGAGFFLPPDAPFLPSLPRPNLDITPHHTSALMRHEEQLLARVNGVLRRRRRQPLERLSRLFHQTDEAFLTTYPELDHFGARTGVTYWGTLPHGDGASPPWPAPEPPRVYAYLYPFRGIEAVLSALRDSRIPSLVAYNGSSDICDRFAGDALRFTRPNLDLRYVAAGCDLAILHAGHGHISAMLLAGKPCLLLPFTVEQYMLSDRVAQLGAGRLLLHRDYGAGPGTVLQMLKLLLGSEDCRRAARRFAQRYDAPKPEEQLTRIADRIEHLL